MNKHALLSASTAHRWLKCPPSARLSEGLESEQSDAALEGEYAHSLAELKLKLFYEKIKVEEYASEYGKLIENKWWNEELEQYVDNFVLYIQEITEKLKDFKIFFEQKISYTTHVPEGYGTIDVLILHDSQAILTDFKYGIGTLVDVKNNPQLKLYALGVASTYMPINKVRTIIYQPRMYNISEEIIDIEDLIKWADSIKHTAQLAFEGKGELNPGEDQCKFCKLNGKCQTRAKEFINLPIEIPTSLPTITPTQLTNILTMGPLFVDWLKSVEKYAEELALSGVKIPGYKLVESKTNRKITDKGAMSDLFLELGYKPDQIFKPTELKNLTDLERLIGKSKFMEVCGQYIEKPKGEPTLVKEDDKRIEIKIEQIV